MTDLLPVAESLQMTAEYLTAHHADLVKTFYQVGAQQERERIQAVEDQCIPGHEALIKQLKFDGKTSGAEAALQVLAAEKQRCAEKLIPIKADSLSPLPISKSLSEESLHSHENKQTTLPQETSWEMQWQKDAALQSEFGSFETYAAFMKAQGNDQINLLNRS